MLGVRIVGTGSALAEREVSTDSLLAQASTRRDPTELRRVLGIDTRWHVGEGEGVVSLAVRALGRALEAAGLEAGDLRRIILSTSTGDTLIPSNAGQVQLAVGADDSCDAFDVSNACCGYLSALDVAIRSVATGLGPVAVIASEVVSPYLSVGNPRSFLIFGDAAAATIIDRSAGEGGMLASFLRTRDDLPGRMHTPHPGRTGKRETIVIDAPLDALAASATSALRTACDRVLGASGLGWDDVHWFLPHQPNGVMFDALVDACGVDPARTVPVAREIGSVGSVSVPFAMDRLFRSGRVRPGDRLLLASVGAGTAYGAILLRAEA